MSVTHPSSAPSLYEHDFYAWLQEQAALLKAGRLAELDIANLTEELESMGKSQKRALGSRLTVLLAHLLKWQHQAGGRGSSWRNTITLQRIDLQDLLKENPSLQPTLPGLLPTSYRKARLWAANETQLDLKTFPPTCPFTPEQALDEDFWPE